MADLREHVAEDACCDLGQVEHDGPCIGAACGDCGRTEPCEDCRRILTTETDRGWA